MQNRALKARLLICVKKTHAIHVYGKVSDIDYYEGIIIFFDIGICLFQVYANGKDCGIFDM